jgi:hypothetical protein
MAQGRSVQPVYALIQHINRPVPFSTKSAAPPPAPNSSVSREFLDHDDPMPLKPFAIPLNPTDVMTGATR